MKMFKNPGSRNAQALEALLWPALTARLELVIALMVFINIRILNPERMLPTYC